MKKFLLLVLIAAGAMSCIKDKGENFDAAAQLAIDDKLIYTYIQTKNLSGYTKDTTGVYYRIRPDSPGNGTKPTLATSSIKFTYKGTLLNDTVFDKGTYTYPLRGLIPAFQIIMPKVGVGGVVDLITPSYYGYGNIEIGKIPKSSVLVFHVKLDSLAN